MENTWHCSAPDITQVKVSHNYAESKIIGPEIPLMPLTAGTSKFRGFFHCEQCSRAVCCCLRGCGGDTQVNLQQKALICFSQVLGELLQLFAGSIVCECCTARGWDCGSNVLLLIPGLGSTCLHIPQPVGMVLLLLSGLREGKSSFNLLFPTWALFFFPPPLDPGCEYKSWRPQS